jgi:hypothetical protein
MALATHDVRRSPVRLPHRYLPSSPTPYTPVPGHVNHIAPATTPDIERTLQIDVDGDGIIGDPKH